MKRKLFLMLVLLVSTRAAWAAGDNRAVSMVTYFPVPYVAYSKVDVTKNMDVGLNGVCQMSLGCADLPTNKRPLQVNNVNVYRDGTLNLLGIKHLKGSNINVGENGVSSNAIADMQFDSLTIDQVINIDELNKNQDIVPTINFKEVTTNKLTLFGKEVPSCREAHPDLNGTNQDGVIVWKELALDPEKPNKKEMYLTCGSDRTCRPPKPDAEKRACEKTDLKPSVVDAEAYLDVHWWSAPGGVWKLRDGVEACGLKTRDHECNAANFQWQPKSTWDTAACKPFFPKEDYDCAFLPPDIRRAKGIPPEATLEGTAKVTKRGCKNGEIVQYTFPTVADYDLSGCSVVKTYKWEFKRHVSYENNACRCPNGHTSQTWTKAADSECNANTVGSSTRDGECDARREGSPWYGFECEGSFDYDVYECVEVN